MAAHGRTKGHCTGKAAHDISRMIAQHEILVGGLRVKVKTQMKVNHNLVLKFACAVQNSLSSAVGDSYLH